MKFPFFIIISFFLFHTSFAQNGNYYAYANRIKQFSKPFRILHQDVNAEGNGSIEFTNEQNQILRFRFQNKKLLPGSCSIAFEIYYYKDNFLRRTESFDSNGNLIECRLKLNDEAATEYSIEKPALYLKKKKIIDDAEGNIELTDDSREKIIRVEFFDSHNNRKIKLQPTYISSKEYWQYDNRTSWP
ncbi:hypothetical protein ASE21_20360 [Flavobacterium sp. Root901]|uniref:hypothetical protein n=1 Tax=Flavobacterium sp. Root901 TaxID=1736605 RepID=UPI00070B965F|nr:hypothetical protein [Flavobacterium sp. Root901]KRD06510.1 hypothetical protein ASE21_20360 [Flavobacterium sp. Root901]